MSDPRPDDDPLDVVLAAAAATENPVEYLRRWIERKVPRSSEPRRQVDRRQPAARARRQDDAERTLQLRLYLLAFLQQLPPEPQWRWTDLLLGLLGDVQLQGLVELALDHDAERRRPRPARRKGRPYAPLLVTVAPHEEATLRQLWRQVAASLKPFATSRTKHWALMNRSRDGTPRSEDVRQACLRSPIGQMVERAGLFDDFFGTAFKEARPTPKEMAARLIHRQEEQRLAWLEPYAREQAATADRREFWLRRSALAAEQRGKLGRWKTFYLKLQAGS